MREHQIFESEYRFCLLLWKNEPISSGELVKLCEKELNWKPTTTYTVIKRLSNRGIIKNVNSVVTSLVSREMIQDEEMEEMIEKKFEGSVPAFMASFTRRQHLSEKEIRELEKIIDDLKKKE